jgi:hypothetical protein
VPEPDLLLQLLISTLPGSLRGLTDMGAGGPA